MYYLYGKINRGHRICPLYGGCPLFGGSAIRGFTVILLHNALLRKCTHKIIKMQ